MSDVALRKESVDRNNSWAVWVKPNFRVALRKESVDRNQDRQDAPHLSPGVALRKESVDRNRASATIITICIASLSARRAWIEISGL